MAPNKPLWRRGVEAVDSAVAPVIEGAVSHERFSAGLSVFQQTRTALFRRTERLSRRVLHGFNLPTASDVNRLLTQLAAVENRVRRLDEQLDGKSPSGASRRGTLPPANPPEAPLAGPTRQDL